MALSCLYSEVKTLIWIKSGSLREAQHELWQQIWPWKSVCGDSSAAIGPIIILQDGVRGSIRIIVLPGKYRPPENPANHGDHGK